MSPLVNKSPLSTRRPTARVQLPGCKDRALPPASSYLSSQSLVSQRHSTGLPLPPLSRRRRPIYSCPVILCLPHRSPSSVGLAGSATTPGLLDKYPAAGNFTTVAMAEGAIEGEAALYEMRSPYSTHFAFSRFDEQDAATHLAFASAVQRGSTSVQDLGWLLFFSFPRSCLGPFSLVPFACCLFFLLFNPLLPSLFLGPFYLLSFFSPL